MVLYMLLYLGLVVLYRVLVVGYSMRCTEIQYINFGFEYPSMGVKALKNVGETRVEWCPQ
jgi:hypothetical protein